MNPIKLKKTKSSKKSFKKMNSFLKTIIVIESILVIILIVSLILDMDTTNHVEETTINHSPDSSFEIQIPTEQISSGDLYQALSEPDQTLETEEENNSSSFDLDIIQSNELSTSSLEQTEQLDEIDPLSFYHEHDPHLKLLAYPSPEFSQSETQTLLEFRRRTKLYVLVELTQRIDFEILDQFKKLKINKIYQLDLYDYLNKKNVFFYIPFYKLNLLAKKKFIKQIYILTDYTGAGYYQLGIKSDDPVDQIDFKIHYPYSKPGHKILKIDNSLSMNSSRQPLDFNNIIENNLSIFQTPLQRDQIIYFLSKIESKISLVDMLINNVRYAGQSITLANYREQMNQEEMEIHQKYTQFTEKIVSSDYIRNIVQQFSDQTKNIGGLEQKSIASIWSQLNFILDRDIKYDWSKRKLFFSGNLPYRNIKDMYMTAKELSEKKVGACTERTSLEIAVLRELGIAARTATRLYHIFTEIYLPQQGWISTSSTLNEIPLCHSTDEKVAYFVEWSPDHSIKLQWTGFLLPKVVMKRSLKKLKLATIK